MNCFRYIYLNWIHFAYPLVLVIFPCLSLFSLFLLMTHYFLSHPLVSFLSPLFSSLSLSLLSFSLPLSFQRMTSPSVGSLWHKNRSVPVCPIIRQFTRTNQIYQYNQKKWKGNKWGLVKNSSKLGKDKNRCIIHCQCKGAWQIKGLNAWYSFS